MFALQQNRGASKQLVEECASGLGHCPQFAGVLNISTKHARDILEQIAFAEDCLRQGLQGMACDVISDMIVNYRNSPSLLLKILLGELQDLIRKPGPLSRQLLAVNSVKAMILRKRRSRHAGVPGSVTSARRIPAGETDFMRAGPVNPYGTENALSARP